MEGGLAPCGGPYLLPCVAYGAVSPCKIPAELDTNRAEPGTKTKKEKKKVKNFHLKGSLISNNKIDNVLC